MVAPSPLSQDDSGKHLCDAPSVQARLTQRRQFIAVRQYGEKIVMPGFVLQYAPYDMLATLAPHEQDSYAVGFTVTRKIGNAVMRNRVKRRLRAMVAYAFPDHVRANYAYVVIGRWSAKTLPFDRLVIQSRDALRRIA
ncbi:MAG: ribonuclease P protein component [Sphaerospermopsis sp. SIO1G2]|nr:ribonuclease P protein component [Sphaerospermopsis sp. SIO1G2]